MIDPEKEREDFVSIRDLVAIIASATEKSGQQAATILAASLAKVPAWSRPRFHQWRPSYGCVALEENGRRENETRQRLKMNAATSAMLQAGGMKAGGDVVKLPRRGTV